MISIQKSKKSEDHTIKENMIMFDNKFKSNNHTFRNCKMSCLYRRKMMF